VLTCVSVLEWLELGSALLCTLAELVEVEVVAGEVEMGLAAGVECMELVVEEEGMDDGLGKLCVGGLDVDVLEVFVDVCWPNRKAGTRRTLAAKLDGRMGYLRIPSRELSILQIPHKLC
jgi:hypothetical protein